MNDITLVDVQKAFKDCHFGLMNMTPTLRAAALLPLVNIKGQPHILFEVRSSSLKRQPGDISFPGGKIDPTDSTPWDAARRETFEELGVSLDQIRLIQKLDTLVSPFGVNLYCFLAEITTDTFDQINPSEVDQIFTIPLSWLLSTEPEVYSGTVAYIPDEGFPYHKITGGKSYQFSKPPYPSYFYDYQNHTIWGMTAFVLYHFIKKLKAQLI